MAPPKQFQWIGAKRPNLETDDFEMIEWPNVKLVNLKETPIKGFKENGVVTAGSDAEEFHEADFVIVATGYDQLQELFST